MSEKAKRVVSNALDFKKAKKKEKKRLT